MAHHYLMIVFWGVIKIFIPIKNARKPGVCRETLMRYTFLRIPNINKSRPKSANAAGSGMHVGGIASP